MQLEKVLKKNMSIAIKLYKQSANFGNIYAKHNLATCYANGNGIEKHYSITNIIFKCT